MGAGSAFNDGLTFVQERHWKEAAVLMQCAAVSFGALHSLGDDSAVHYERRQQRTALLVGVASHLESANGEEVCLLPHLIDRLPCGRISLSFALTRSARRLSPRRACA